MSIESIRKKIEEVDWTQYCGPEAFEPESVAPVLLSLLDLKDSSEANRVGNWFSSVSFAAALATIAAVEEDNVIDSLQSSGDLLRSGLDQQAKSYGFSLNQTGPSQMPLVLIEDDPMWEKNNFFCNEAVQRGVYLHPWHNMFICAAHTPDVINKALERTDDAFAALKKQLG